jgi:glycosyltransferase involved in cell wall biosynthesis
MHNALSGSQSIRRNFFKLVLDSCDSLQVNSLDTKNKHEKIFGKSISLSNKITQIGVPIEKNQSSPKNLKFSFQKNINAHKLNIALIGNFTAEKGGHFFIQIFNQLKDWPIHFYIFGRIDKPFDEILHNSTFSNVTVHGIYKPYELRALLTGMHASIHNSIWPETYCLTLSEAWNAGILPIVSDIGALGERVTDSVNGLKFPVENIGRVVDILKFLASSPNTVSEIVKNAEISDLSYGSTHKKWLSKKYLEISKIHPKNLKKLSGKYNSEISLKDCGVFLNNIIWLHK